MGWFSGRWLCGNEECKEMFDEIVDSELKDSVLDCPECGLQTAKRVPFANITKASYVDGNNRFSEIKERRKLQVAERMARRAGDADAQRDIKKELSNYIKPSVPKG